MKKRADSYRSFATATFLQQARVAWLDEIRYEVFNRHRKRLSRVDLIRALIDAAMTLDRDETMNFVQPSSEALTAQIRLGFSGKGRSGECLTI